MAIKVEINKVLANFGFR